jgi:ELWxxDGT repeat protein
MKNTLNLILFLGIISLSPLTAQYHEVSLVKDLNFTTDYTKNSYFEGNYGSSQQKSSNPSGFIKWNSDIYISGKDSIYRMNEDLTTIHAFTKHNRATSLSHSANALIYYDQLNLYASDGFSQGNLLMYLTNPGQDVMNTFFEFNGLCYFFKMNNIVTYLWSTDGTVAGTKPIKYIGQINLFEGNLSVIKNGDKFYFSNGKGVWVSDGSEAGTQLLFTGPGQYGYTLGPVLFNNSIYFVGEHPDTGRELWVCDDLATGATHLVIDASPGTLSTFNSASLTPIAGNLYFNYAKSSSGGNINGLGVYNPILDTVFQLTQDWQYLSAQNLVEFNGKAYFINYKSDNNFNFQYKIVYSTDGTVAGTHPIYDGNVTLTSTIGANFLIPYKGRLYFKAVHPSNPDVYFWNTDGNDLRPILDAEDLYISNAIVVQDKLLLAGYDASIGTELLKLEDNPTNHEIPTVFIDTVVGFTKNILNLAVSKDGAYEKASVAHRYYKVTNQTGQPLENVILKYKYITSDGYLDYLASYPSDASGLCEVVLPSCMQTTDGFKYLTSVDLFFEKVLSVNNIFYDTVYTTNRGFTPFSVFFYQEAAIPAVYGASIGAVAGINGCAGCVEAGGTGFGGVQVSLEGEKSIGITMKNDALNETVYSMIFGKSIKLGVSANLFETPVDAVKVDLIDASIKYTNNQIFSNFKIQNSGKDYLTALYWFAQSQTDGLSGASAALWGAASKALEVYLKDHIEEKVFDYGTNWGLTGNITAGFNLPIKQATGLDVNFNLFSVSGTLGFEYGSEISKTKQTRSNFFKHNDEYKFDLFSLNKVNTPNLGVSLFTGFTKSNKGEFNVARIKNMNGTYKGSSLTISDFGKSGSGFFTRERVRARTSYFDIPLLNASFNNFSNNDVSKILTGTGSAIQNAFNAAFSGGTTDSYKNLVHGLATSSDSLLVYNNLKNYSTVSSTITAAFEPVFSFDLALGIGGGGTVGIKLKSYQTLTAPLDSSIYHSPTKTFLPFVTKNSNLVPNDAFGSVSILFDKMKNALTVLGDLIYDVAVDVGCSAPVKVVTFIANPFGGTLLDYACDRLTSLTGNGNVEANRTNSSDVSTLDVFVPKSGDAFVDGTNIKNTYYYPEGQLRGLMPNLDTFVVLSNVYFLEASQNNVQLATAPLGNFKLYYKAGKDDLDFLGLADGPVSLVYKNYTDTTWTVMGTVSNFGIKDSVETNKLGIYALARILPFDQTPPVISIMSMDTILTRDSLTATITDAMSGINWNSVVVTLDGKEIPFRRIGLTSEIIFPAYDTVLLNTNDILITVQARDLSGNFAYTVLTETVTSTQQLVLHENLLGLFPNPTQDELKITWISDKSQDITLVITDISGREVQRLKEKSSYNQLQQTTFNVSNLDNGMYFLQFLQGNKVKDVRKFIKL